MNTPPLPQLPPEALPLGEKMLRLKASIVYWVAGKEDPPKPPWKAYSYIKGKGVSCWGDTPVEAMDKLLHELDIK